MPHRFVALLMALIIGVAWSGDAAAASKEAPSAAQIAPVDLNTATQDQLEALPGIGATRAEAIIAGRPYAAVDDLLNKGIVTQSILDKIKSSVVVAVGGAKPSDQAKKASPSKAELASGPIDLNNATAEELDALPGVGAARAAKIVAGRPYATIDDLLSKGIVTKGIFEKIKGDIVVSGSATSGEAKKTSEPAKSEGSPPAGPVDLNTATADEIEALPGIGAARAKAIIAGRPYAAIEDLTTKGVVSASLFDKIKNDIRVAAPVEKAAGRPKTKEKEAPAAGPVDLNSATGEELVALPGIGPSRAKAIIAGRPYATASDLVSKGIVSQSVLDKIQGIVTVSVSGPAAQEASKAASEEDEPAPPEPTGRVDLNTATADELEALEGIGEVRAQAIIKGRPYDAPGDLVTQKILPQGVFDDIRGSIEVASLPAAGRNSGGGREAMIKRIRACGAEWQKNRAAGKIVSGQTWPQFWSACNKRLKAAGM